MQGVVGVSGLPKITLQNAATQSRYGALPGRAAGTARLVVVGRDRLVFISACAIVHWPFDNIPTQEQGVPAPGQTPFFLFRAPTIAERKDVLYARCQRHGT
jgi:hypothetical protein